MTSIYMTMSGCVLDVTIESGQYASTPAILFYESRRPNFVYWSRAMINWRYNNNNTAVWAEFEDGHTESHLVTADDSSLASRRQHAAAV